MLGVAINTQKSVVKIFWVGAVISTFNAANVFQTAISYLFPGF